MNFNNEGVIQFDHQDSSEEHQNHSSQQFSFNGHQEIQNFNHISQIKHLNIPSEKKQIYYAYTRLKEDRKPNKFHKSQPHIQITVYKNTGGIGTEQNVYYVNEYGLCDTLKNTDTEDIIIGRQEKFENDFGQNIIPNDIVLEEKERLISRIHCRIIYKNYFSQIPLLHDLYKRTIKYLTLPKPAKCLLEQFLYEPKSCFVYDIGSTCGTYLRIERKEAIKMEQNQIFSVGSDTTIQVLYTHLIKKNLLNYDKYEYQKILYSLSDKQHKCQIHGNNQRELEDSLIPIDDLSLDEILLELSKYNVPFLLLKFSGTGIYSNILHLFLAMDKQQFTIGRSSENDLKINSNTISRKQTRFFYNQKKNQWQIGDGIEDRESANGTWMQLAKGQQDNYRYPLKDFSEIKISDYILKIRLFQGSKKKKNQQ